MEVKCNRCGYDGIESDMIKTKGGEQVCCVDCYHEYVEERQN